MSRACSVSARRVYGKVRMCRLWEVARSTHYARQAASGSASAPRRRGRPPVVSDETLVAAIRDALEEAEGLGFRGEGYRKVWARLRFQGVRTSKERIRRLMREHGLQAPHRTGNAQGPRVHDGSLIPEGPNQVWGTDATQVMTRLEGAATVFVAVDHFVGDLVGAHAARPGTRFEALEPLHQGIREHFGPLSPTITEGLTLCHDHGPQYVSDHFQREKEQLLWVRHFDTVEELRQALLEFKDRYNRNWLLQRHGYRTPEQVRMEHGAWDAAA